MRDNAYYLAAISSFSSKRILLIGDIMLDVYLKGQSTRLCPEAPVPIVDVHERVVAPGGAANTAYNLSALGASVIFCSVVGKDSAGDEALATLKERGIDTDRIARSPGRMTLTKTRVVSGGHVITRIDEGSEGALDISTTDVLLNHIESAYTQCDAVVISDYDKGIINDALLSKISDLQRKNKLFIAVDSKRLSFFSSLKPSFAKPNYSEALSLLNMSFNHDRVQQITQYARELFMKVNASLISVTLDKNGSVVMENGIVTEVIPAPPVPNPSVAGAGDCYLSAFVLTYLETGDAFASAEIGTAAAAIAVTQESTATCTRRELEHYFNINVKIISGILELRKVCDVYHDTGKRIVFTNGCFDILHSGHVSYLHQARQQGDVLIVGLNTDQSIRRIKGSERPINGFSDRLQVLAGLSSVDHIVPFGEETDDTPIPLIAAARPHVFVKGGDYTKEKLPEAERVEACGGRIVFIRLIPDRSTTQIISRIHSHTSEPGRAIARL